MLDILRKNEVVDEAGNSFGKVLGVDGSEIRIRNIPNLEERVTLLPDGKIEVRASMFRWTETGDETELSAPEAEEATNISRVGEEAERETPEPPQEERDIASEPEEVPKRENVVEEPAGEARTVPVVEAAEESEPDVETVAKSGETTESRLEADRGRGTVRVISERSGIRGGQEFRLSPEAGRAVIDLQNELIEGRRFGNFFGIGESGPDHNDLMSITSRLVRGFGLDENQSKRFAFFLAEGRRMGKETFAPFFDEGNRFKPIDFKAALDSFRIEVEEPTLPTEISETFVPRRFFSISGRNGTVREVFGFVRKAGEDQYEYMTETMKEPQRVIGDNMRQMMARPRR